MESKGRKIHSQAEMAREKGEVVEALRFTDEAMVVYQEEGDKLGLSEETIVTALQAIKLPKPRGQNETSVGTKSSPEQMVEEHLLGLVIQASDIARALHEVSEQLDPSELIVPQVRRIFILLIDYLAQHTTFDYNSFARSLPAELMSTSDKALLQEDAVLVDPIAHKKEQTKTVTLVKRNLLRRKIGEFTTKIKALEDGQHETEIAGLTDRLSLATAALKSLN